MIIFKYTHLNIGFERHYRLLTHLLYYIRLPGELVLKMMVDMIGMPVPRMRYKSAVDLGVDVIWNGDLGAWGGESLTWFDQHRARYRYAQRFWERHNRAMLVDEPVVLPHLALVS